MIKRGWKVVRVERGRLFSSNIGLPSERLKGFGPCLEYKVGAWVKPQRRKCIGLERGREKPLASDGPLYVFANLDDAKDFMRDSGGAFIKQEVWKCEYEPSTRRNGWYIAGNGVPVPCWGGVRGKRLAKRVKLTQRVTLR